ncbi:MAG: glycerate kinase type-2 family protein [Terriglobales bacterium]
MSLPGATEHKRAILESIALGTLTALEPGGLVRQAIVIEGPVLRIAGGSWELHTCPQITLIAVGKAAAPMIRAAQAALAAVAERVRGVVVAPAPASGPCEVLPRGIEPRVGGHPEPTVASLRAARALLRAVAATPPRGLILYLISGGGSALAEAPLPGVSFTDLRQTHRALVRSGAPIGAINAVRKHLSAIKGGRLALAAQPAVEQVSLLLSDVPAGDVSAISSGPTCPDTSTLDDCRRICGEYSLVLPLSARAALFGPGQRETPKPSVHGFARSRWEVLMDNAGAKAEAARRARAAGLAPVLEDQADEAECRAAADFLLRRLAQARRQNPRACVIAGGEVRVRVGAAPGRGGRNQAFALHCAAQIAGGDCCVLSLGTDGVDGNSPAAGACVDGGTAERARAAGFDLERAQAQWDAYPLLAAAGDVIEIGPTGNNLRDLRLLA